MSDPEAWQALHHHSSDDDGSDEGPPRLRSPNAEPEGEPQGDDHGHWDNRIFLIFNALPREKYTRWGRRIQPQFEWEAETWTTDAVLKKTFFELRLLAVALDEGRVEQVEKICLMLEGVIDPADVPTELNQLEEGMTDNLGMIEAIRWLYMRYRAKCIGPEFDKIKWAAEVYGSPEESLRVSQERALDAINDRIEMAYIRGDQEEVEELEALRRGVGLY